MKKRRNQDFATIIAILALVCHFGAFPFTGKCAVLQTKLSLLENNPKSKPPQISRAQADLDACVLKSRILKSAAFLFAILSLIFCYRSIKARESGARVAFCVIMVIFLVAFRMN